MERIPLSGLITPIYETDKYPVIDPRFGIDGLRSLDTTTDMYDLPLEKRRAGMVVGIPNTASNNVFYYKLKPEGNGITWSIGSASNWDGFFSSVTGSSAIPVKYNIVDETIVVPTNYEYLLWGDMTISGSGSFINDGKAYFINGTISTSGNGTFSGGGQYNFITVPTKYKETFTCSPFGVTISHGLSTEDITYSVRQNNNFVFVNVEVINTNSIKVTSYTTFSNAKITIIG